ncbi:MAG: RAD55 family ATPase [Candidatus Bathyarchaeia archaeon]
MKLLKIGIAGLDEILQGGLTSGVYLLLGPPESGIEIFARQVAHYRAKQGKVTYFTVAKTPENIKDEMAAYGWDITPMEETDSWRFVTITQTEPLTTAVAKEMKQQRSIIIDSLSELLLTHKIEEVIDLLRAMSTQNRESEELHFILLTEGMQDPKTETAMQHFADGVIKFSATWENETSTKTLMIKKIKGTAAPTRRLPYSIGKKGFTIETAIRIT